MKAIYMMLSGLLLSVIATLAMAGLLSVSALIKPKTNHSPKIESNTHYEGKWITKNAVVQYVLLPDGSYTEVKKGGSTENGTYIINDDHIFYKDHSGLTSQGNFKNDTLYYKDYVLYKEN